ncbi:MAG: hypothetical protein WCO63_15330 [Bacteroidota bacterium]
MKIAIATTDGLNMSSSYEEARGFLIIKENFNEIVHEELRWKPGLEKTDFNRDYLMISACSQLVVREISVAAKQFFMDKGIAVFVTKEDIITNVILHFLEKHYREASNTCCCP